MNAQTFARYAADPAAFRNDLIVDVDGTARKLGAVMDDWQRADFAAIDPALQRCNGRKPDANAKGRAYLERPRGHSKTTDLACTCVWALAFAARPISAYAFAADLDQAKLLKAAMATVVRLNPWLSNVLDVQKDVVINVAKGHPGEGGKLQISTSDVASSWGILPDLIIADELTHWPESASALWESLISSAAKRSNCLLVTITNAGFADSWQWKVREVARDDDAWYFSRLDGPQASWMTPARLAEQRRMLPQVAFSRLWENIWSTGGGDALTPADIAAAFRPELEPMTGDEKGWLFVAGVDLGIKRDCSAVVVLAIPEGGGAGRIRLAHHKLWKPLPGQKINVSDVEKHLLDLDERFDLKFIGYDPWQAEHMAQRLEALTKHRRRATAIYKPKRPSDSVAWIREMPPTPKYQRQQTTLTIEFFTDRRFQLYPCPPLERDLLKLRVEEKNYGLRLSSPRDGDGHGDTFSAFGLALVIGHELAGKKPVTAGGFADGKTVFERQQESVRQRQEQFAREQMEALTPEPFNAPFIELMKRVGRA